jgi:cytochrome c-type biogenesis protein CcmF
MMVELGHYALVLALAVAVLQMAMPAAAAWRNDPALRQVASTAAVVQLVLIATAFLALMRAYVTSDFSVINVWSNSHAAKPLLYKISGVWGNHEGSMVLWVLILASFGAAVALFGRNLPASLKATVLAVQASISVAFLLFILSTSNPFLRQDPAPLEGMGLNPILQDPALSFHPPMLYAGYVGFSMAFSFAVAALIEGRIDGAWARWVRPWTLAAWMSLTLGIAMGSWWAYYELGWGGWWFWDPVENASFMPWLAGTALLHSALVMEKREALKVWTILLAILAFSLSLMGTFLVRSGILTSVHAFAVDPERGTFVLGILALFTGGGLALFAWRAPRLRQGGLFQPISREGALVLNNLLLAVSCLAVFVGTLYPLFYEAVSGDKISVGAPFFNLTFGPLMVPLLLALPFGPTLAWKRGDLYGAAQRLYVAAALGIVALVAALALSSRGPSLALLGCGLGVWIAAGSVSDLVYRIKLFSVPAADSWRRLTGLPRAALGTVLAHFGVGVSVLGIIATTAWQSEQILTMKPGEATDIAGYRVVYDGVAPRRGPNYQEEVSRVTIEQNGAVLTRLEPSRRTYPAERQSTTEAGILASMWGDLYVVPGDRSDDGGQAFRLYFNPLVRLIWIGAVLMFVAGALSLSDRRLRVGAPVRSGRMPAVAAE